MKKLMMMSLMVIGLMVAFSTHARAEEIGPDQQTLGYYAEYDASGSLTYFAWWGNWGFNWKTFSGCAAAEVGIAAVWSFALGPAGPEFFFIASGAALADCGGKAFIPDLGTAK